MAFGDFTVVRSTVKNVLGSNGLIGQVAINTPAFEFNADGSYKGLLVEPGATNLALYSQQFDDGYWSKDSLTVDPNSTTAPDGTTTADKLTATGADSFSQSTAITSVSGQTYTFSVYLKADTPTTLALYCLNPVTAQSVNVTTEWQRFSITVAVNSTTVRWQIGGGGTFTTGEVIYAWGAQVELGSVATSPIYTVGSTVARTADNITLTSASSLIGQLTGAVYCEVNMRQFSGGFRRAWSTRVTTGGQSTSLLFNNLDTLVGVRGVSVTISPIAYPVGISKYLITYTAGDIRVYRNGALIGSSTSAYVNSDPHTVIYLGNDDQGAGSIQQANDHLRAFATFTTSFTSAQAIAITTL
jgi:hypothetical protein